MAIYIVQPGDNPTKIAKKFGITFDQFSALNPGLCQGMNCRTIQIGERLNVPGAVTQPTQPVIHQPAAVPNTPPWMLIAQRELGQAEWNPGNNPRILQYLASVGLGGPDETSWCGAFTNWCLRAAGYPSANTGHAASWANWGRAVQPVYGAVTVLKPLAAGASGHVGFLHAIVGSQVWLLSGNSSNAVRLSAYDSSKLIDHAHPFRWPV